VRSFAYAPLPFCYTLLVDISYKTAGRGTLGKDGGRKRRDEVEVASSPLLIRERESRMRWS